MTQSTSDSSARSAWIEAQLGSEVGIHHRIVRPLASGGMAHVFLAESLLDGSHAAVKLTDPASDAPDALLAHEARVLGRLHHPHVVKLIELSSTCTRGHGLLLEYVTGVDLDEWLEHAQGKLPLERAMGILRQLASAIDHLHACSIVHGDIKPANVMLDVHAADRVTLIDFGLAFDAQVDSLRAGSTGTPGFMAPEQVQGGTCGPAIDLYAFAVVAFELITGVALSKLPRSLTLDRVFARALCERPEGRFDSATAFVSALASTHRQPHPSAAIGGADCA